MVRLAPSQDPEQASIWQADSACSAVLRSCLSLVDKGVISPPSERYPWSAVSEGGELMEQLFEYLTWPRDVDTGLRVGFPGRDLWVPPGYSWEQSPQPNYDEFGL